jgi:predicted Fe-Mo cluster-binding NifX family protein
MNILIPVDNNDIDEAKITLLDSVQCWMLIDFTKGKILKSESYQAREEITDWVDVIVVKNDKEYVWPFMEEGIAVLVAPTQMYVEDVLEAFLFKELHDLNINQ